MRSAWRIAAPGIFSPLEAMSTAADWVGCLSNFRRPNFLRTGEPEADAAGAGAVTVTARSRPAWWTALGTALRGDHRGPGRVAEVDAAGRPEDQRHLAPKASIPRRLSLILRHQ